MKKREIVCTVLACVLLVLGLALMAGASVPYRFSYWYGGYAFSYQGIGGLWYLHRLLLGGILFIGGMVMLGTEMVLASLRGLYPVKKREEETEPKAEEPKKNEEEAPQEVK